MALAMPSPRDRPFLPAMSGTMFALIAFAGFPIGDAVFKSLAGYWPAGAIAALRFVIGASALAAMLWWFEGRAGFRVNRPWLHVARGFALAFGTYTFISAIFVMPLADAAAISFVNPVLTALFSGWFLGERMHKGAWGATALAFAGVLVMLRPNVAAFGWVAVLPLLAAVGIASLIVLNRMVSSGRSVLAAQFMVAFWCAIFLMLATIGGHFLLPGVPELRVAGPPQTVVVLACVLVAITATTCHFLMYMATVRASAASIAPFIYVQLLVATLISVFVFGDPIDSLVLLGGAMIVVAGLWVIWVQRGTVAVRVKG